MGPLRRGAFGGSDAANPLNDNNRGDLPQKASMQHSITTSAVSLAMWCVTCAFIVALLAMWMLTSDEAEADSIRVASYIYYRPV
jgi:hypothetical protein